MPAKKIEVDLGPEAAIRALDVLNAKAAELEQRLKSLTSILGSGTASNAEQAQFFSTLEQYSGVQGAISAARSSVASGTTVNRETLAGGAMGGTAAFGANVRSRQVADPQAIINMAQGAGVSGMALGVVVQQLANGNVPYTPGSVTASQVISQVVQSVQAVQANPFAVLPQSGPSLPINGYGMNAPVGPYSSIGTPGYQMNAYLMQQQQQRLSQQQQLRTVGLGMGVQTITGGLSLGAQNTVSGELDPMAAASFWGSAVGGAAGLIGGALIGSLSPDAPEPGLGALIGGQLGREAGGAFASYLMAPFVRTRSAVMAMQSVSARANVDPYALMNGDDGFPGGGLRAMSDRITFGGKTARQKALIKMGLYSGTDVASPLKLAQAFSSLGSGLLQAGENPMAAMDMTETLGRKYGTGVANMAALAAPVAAARNRLGGNATDLFLEFGPEAYGAYSDATHSAGISPRQMSSFRDLQAAQYQASIASLQARGSGAATQEAVQRQMASIASLPDGRSSRAYAEAAAAARDAGRMRFEQEGVAAFGIPMAHLQGERERLNVLPFSPGNRFANDLRTIALDNREINRLRGYMNQRRKAGELSEEEELSLTQRIEGLETSKAYGVASLSSGMENRLPGLQAGRGRTFSQWNSVQLAQMALWRVHSPVRDFGAINGQQMQEQNDWLAGFNVRGVGPRSRTQGMNAGGDDRLASAMNRLADVIERGMTSGRIGSMTRAGEAAGALGGAIAQRNPGSGLNGKAN